MMLRTPTARAAFVTRRTYNRPIDQHDSGAEIFETWEQTIDRTIEHQRWLWERQLGRTLNTEEKDELEELRALQLNRYALLAGRTLWLGGTEIAKTRECSQFNCAGTTFETVFDAVDIFWLLLNSCGVGHKSIAGGLYGFPKPIEVETVRSQRTAKGGKDTNTEWYDKVTGTWYLTVGDSSEAWAKAVGKLISHKHHGCKKLVLSFEHIRPTGARLGRYGWQSCGDELIHNAFLEIIGILNRAADRNLTEQEIGDIGCLMGTCLSNRRAAQIRLKDFGSPGYVEFAECKTTMFNEDFTLGEHWYRDQSNNTLVHWEQPEREDLELQFDLMLKAGGSEPGICNGKEALRRAPWFHTANPCFEILLANGGFCNLVTVNLHCEYHRNIDNLHRTLYIIARANYRQTCVDLNDGILQRKWHDNNQMLRLCGVSLCGVYQRPDLLNPRSLQAMRAAAHLGANSMADEFGTPRSKNITTIKPEGTASKIMETLEEGAVAAGGHAPLGRYIINTINFGKDDPLVPVLREAGYRIDPNPRILPTCWSASRLTMVRTCLRWCMRLPLSSLSGTGC
jgi:adenosylcobalamin-dependent ribonucleoside-triphosphate reductase